MLILILSDDGAVVFGPGHGLSHGYYGIYMSQALPLVLDTTLNEISEIDTHPNGSSPPKDSSEPRQAPG